MTDEELRELAEDIVLDAARNVTLQDVTRVLGNYATSEKLDLTDAEFAAAARRIKSLIDDAGVDVFVRARSMS